MVDVSECVMVDDAAAAAADAAAAIDDIVDTVMGRKERKVQFSAKKDLKTKRKLLRTTK